MESQVCQRVPEDRAVPADGDTSQVSQQAARQAFRAPPPGPLRTRPCGLCRHTAPGRSLTPQRWAPLPGSCPQSRGVAWGSPAAPHTGDPAQGPCSGQARHKRPGAIGNAGGTMSGVTARAGGQRSRLPRTRAPGQAAPGRLGRAGPGPPRGAVGAYGGWRPLQAAAGRTPGASAAAAAARRSQCHGVRRRARGRAGDRPPARSPRPGPRMQPSPWSGGGGSRSSRGPPGSGCCSRGTGCSPSSPPSCSTPWRR